MNTEEVKQHLLMKSRFNSYPSLPLVYTATTKEEKAKAKRLSEPSKKQDSLGDYKQSVTRGFLKRVRNWEKDHQAYDPYPKSDNPIALTDLV
jgi:hypothetical protein